VVKKANTKGLTLELKGFEELITKFDQLTLKLQKKYLKPSLKAGAKVIQVAAKNKAHKRSGKNARFIRVKALKRQRGRSVGSSIQTGTREQLGIPRSAKGYYPFSEEYGTKDTPAHPYMRPALAQKRGEAIKRIGKVLGAAIAKGEKI
jgi:HK97 gp10 family phage protein